MTVIIFSIVISYQLLVNGKLEGGRPEAVSKPSIRTHQALNCGRDFRSRKWYRAAICALNKIYRLFQLRRNLRRPHFWGVLRQPLLSHHVSDGLCLCAGAQCEGAKVLGRAVENRLVPPWRDAKVHRCPFNVYALRAVHKYLEGGCLSHHVSDE